MGGETYTDTSYLLTDGPERRKNKQTNMKDGRKANARRGTEGERRENGAPHRPVNCVKCHSMEYIPLTSNQSCIMLTSLYDYCTSPYVPLCRLHGGAGQLGLGSGSAVVGDGACVLLSASPPVRCDSRAVWSLSA